MISPLFLIHGIHDVVTGPCSLQFFSRHSTQQAQVFTLRDFQLGTIMFDDSEWLELVYFIIISNEILDICSQKKV